ncbi:MAG: nucleotidyltransferase domain-containing protein [Kiritimatiellae bacterium]|jgi:predicted nucleotidyltransferase|nr:nucleotidyltransferase domain-containing protein [Kiritimatiellia bacterium]
MKFGLSTKIITDLNRTFDKFPSISKVIIYGSRAKGTYTPGSDIDITLIGDNLTQNTIFKLEEEIEKLYIPNTFDISILSDIENSDLISHIQRMGKTFYKA